MVYTALRVAMIYQACDMDKKRKADFLVGFLFLGWMMRFEKYNKTGVKWGRKVRKKAKIIEKNDKKG